MAACTAANLNVKGTYMTADGLPLGNWVRQLRAKRKAGTLTLKPEELQRLDELGFVWGNKYGLAWEAGFRELQSHFKEHGNLNLPFKYTTA